MGLFSGISDIIGTGESLGSFIIENGLQDALSTMESMPGNEGQMSIYENYVAPAFIDTAQGTLAGDGWPGIDIGDYMDFMGEIVEAGNQIMEEAYDYAAWIEGDSSAGEDIDEETGESLED